MSFLELRACRERLAPDTNLIKAKAVPNLISLRDYWVKRTIAPFVEAGWWQYHDDGAKSSAQFAL